MHDRRLFEDTTRFANVWMCGSHRVFGENTQHYNDHRKRVVAAVGSLTLDLLARVEWGELDYCLGVHIIKFY